MRAKTINEIRQNVEGSGLAPIGIGKSGMNAAYKNASILSPNIKSIESKNYTKSGWASLLPLKDLMPKLLDTVPENVIMVGSNGISDEAENYLHTQVFNDGKYLTKTTTMLEWKDTENFVEAIIHTNNIKGASIVEYTTPEDRFVVYFFFRTR